MMRNGIRANSASDSFTAQSAMANDTQSGASGPMPRTGKITAAQLTSPCGSSGINSAENAMVKNRIVSTEEPTKVDTKGAFHHTFWRTEIVEYAVGE